MMSRTPEPCDSYFGNVCSGFGGSTICGMCGWEKWDHDEQETVRALIEKTQRAVGAAEVTCDRVVPKDDKTQTTCGKPAVWKHPNYPLYYCKDHGV